MAALNSVILTNLRLLREDDPRENVGLSVM